MKKIIITILLYSVIAHAMDENHSTKNEQKQKNISQKQSYTQKEINGIIVIESKTEVTTPRAYELVSNIQNEHSQISKK